MSLKNIASLFILILILAACAGPVATEESTEIPAIVTDSPQIATPTVSIPTPYPEPDVVTSPPPQSAYPAPGEPGTATPEDATSGYEPQPGDENLARGEVFIDMANSELAAIATQPTQAQVTLVGNLPDPCHKLRVVVNPPDADNVVNLEAYSVVDPAATCIAMLDPFSAIIPLGSFDPGVYKVFVNGEKMGEFDAAIGPQPGDDKLTRGELSVDMESSTLQYTSEQPLEVSASLQGYLPDPCHQLRIVYTPANDQNEINLEVYSVFDASTACITVIQPYNVIYPLGSFGSGHYTVLVNGELLGEFDG